VSIKSDYQSNPQIRDNIIFTVHIAGEASFHTQRKFMMSLWAEGVCWHGGIHATPRPIPPASVYIAESHISTSFN
jgi:hypothetical protein